MSSFVYHDREAFEHPNVLDRCSLHGDLTVLRPDSTLCLWCNMGFEEFQRSISITGSWVGDVCSGINKYKSRSSAEEIVRRSWWLQFQLKQVGYELPKEEEE